MWQWYLLKVKLLKHYMWLSWQKHFHFWKLGKNLFPSLKHRKCSSLSALCVALVLHKFLSQAFVKIKVCFCLYKYYVLNAMYCVLGAPTSTHGGPNHLAPALVTAWIFTATERLVLFREMYWKPSTGNTVTVLNKVRKVPDFPVII